MHPCTPSHSSWTYFFSPQHHVRSRSDSLLLCGLPPKQRERCVRVFGPGRRGLGIGGFGCVSMDIVAIILMLRGLPLPTSPSCLPSLFALSLIHYPRWRSTRLGPSGTPGSLVSRLVPLLRTQTDKQTDSDSTYIRHTVLYGHFLASLPLALFTFFVFPLSLSCDVLQPLQARGEVAGEMLREKL